MMMMIVKSACMLDKMQHFLLISVFVVIYTFSFVTMIKHILGYNSTF